MTTPAPAPDDWRPRLVPGIVLRRDRARDTDVLLMPERVVVLHGRAAAVLKLCDGTRTVPDIVGVLSSRFPQAPVGDDVRVFLDRTRKEGWIR